MYPREKVNKDAVHLCVIGLGTVGFPTAARFASRGFKVIGVDVVESIVEKVNRGQSLSETKIVKQWFDAAYASGKISATTDFSSAIKNCNFFIICVPTPIDQMKKPDLTPLKFVSGKLSKYIRPGSIVVVESTVWPGATEDTVGKILEQESGLKIGTDIGLAHLPERIDPGNERFNLQNIPRVVGGNDAACTRIVKKVYELGTGTRILPVSNIKTAEAIKLTENTYRDINIAFVNEMAIIFGKLGIDIMEVIKGASTKPFAFHPHYPGPGVGGDCIPVNPYYLAYKANEVGIEPSLIMAARKINEQMPYHVIELIVGALNKLKKPVCASRIAVLGFTYKGDVKDTRHTPSLLIVKELKSMNADLIGYDPYLSEKELEEMFSIPAASNLESALKEAECIVLLTDHSMFKNYDFEKAYALVKKPCAFVDCRNIVSATSLKNKYFYVGIGGH